MFNVEWTWNREILSLFLEQFYKSSTFPYQKKLPSRIGSQKKKIEKKKIEKKKNKPNFVEGPKEEDKRKEDDIGDFPWNPDSKNQT